MKSWYSTKDGSNLSHGNVAIKPGQKIFITEAQAKLHGEGIEKSEAPQSADEAGVKTEFEEWKKAKGNISASTDKTVETKEKGDTKAK